MNTMQNIPADRINTMKAIFNIYKQKIGIQDGEEIVFCGSYIDFDHKEPQDIDLAVITNDYSKNYYYQRTIKKVFPYSHLNFGKNYSKSKKQVLLHFWIISQEDLKHNKKIRNTVIRGWKPTQKNKKDGSNFDGDVP